MVQRKCVCGGTSGVSGVCTECQNNQLQRNPAALTQLSQPPPIVTDVLQSNGHPLDAATQESFEGRFAHEFNRVRIHDDARAAESARAVNARAYTVGSDIVFGAGLYEPRSEAGTRLLAHELAHVVQQRGQPFVPAAGLRVGAADDVFEKDADRVAESVMSWRGIDSPDRVLPTASLQRDEDKSNTAARVDVAIVLDDSELALDEARAYAKTVFRVISAEDAKKKLTDLGQPIGTLYVVSHSNRLGEVELITGSGTINWVKISDFGKGLQGALAADKAPTNVDFRGCKLGEAPDQMKSFQKSVGAGSAQAFNCWSFAQRVTPLTANGVEIKKPSDIPKGMEAEFNKQLWKQVAGLEAANKVSVKDCLIGFPKGTALSWKNLQKIRDLYFKNDGLLVAGWASPEFNENWQEGSICTKNLTESTSLCKIVKTAASGGSGKKSATQPKANNTDIASVSAETPAEELSS